MATNKLKFGTETPTKLYMGATEVTKAYMGETLVYENSTLTVYTSQDFDDEDTTSNRWRNENFKTITITSKLSKVANGDALLALLQANATKQ